MNPLSIIGAVVGKAKKTYGILRFLANPPLFNALCRMRKANGVGDRVLSSHIEIPNHWEHLTGDFKCYLFVTHSHLFISYTIGKRKCLYCSVLADGLGTYLDEVWVTGMKEWDLREQTFEETLVKMRHQIDAKLRSLAFNLGVVPA